jgi:sarcosine oxidase, subunit gamma
MQYIRNSNSLHIKDVSELSRYGVKGQQSVRWLSEHGIVIPKNSNSWVMDDQTLVMRLGVSEFLIEDQVSAKKCEKLISDSVRVAGVYKVPRADASFLLTGSEVLNLFSELCSLDLRETALPADGLVMTQVAGISATVLRQTLKGETAYRIWCDGTYSVYMWHVLSEVAGDISKLAEL